MIKYEKEVDELECATDIECHNDNECNFDENKPAIKKLIKQLLIRQIDEDNKRFLGELRKIGSITLSCQHFDGLYVPLEEMMKLRDKVNKK